MSRETWRRHLIPGKLYQRQFYPHANGTQGWPMEPEPIVMFLEFTEVQGSLAIRYLCEEQVFCNIVYPRNDPAKVWKRVL